MLAKGSGADIPFACRRPVARQDYIRGKKFGQASVLGYNRGVRGVVKAKFGRGFSTILIKGGVMSRVLAVLVCGGAIFGGAAALTADETQDAIDAFGERFFLAEVTTDLERRLLGNHQESLDDASVCVFVDSREFAGDEEISAKARPFRLLAAYLEARAQIDDRLVVFKVIDGVEGEAFETVRTRSQRLSEICDEVGREAGYREIKSTETYGVVWRERMDEAQEALRREEAAAEEGMPREEPAGRAEAGNERLRVYAVRTHLERLLVDADCIVDVRPVLRETEGNHFPDDFVAEIQEFLPQVEIEGRRSMQLEIHHIEAVQPHVMGWINDRQKRTDFAAQFGFETCQLSMSLTDD
jgi:hypothetical protein